MHSSREVLPTVVCPMSGIAMPVRGDHDPESGRRAREKKNVYSIGCKNVWMGTGKTLKEKQFTTQANVSLFLAHFLQNELVMQSMSPAFSLGFVRERASRLPLISNVYWGNVTLCSRFTVPGLGCVCPFITFQNMLLLLRWGTSTRALSPALKPKEQLTER